MDSRNKQDYVPAAGSRVVEDSSASCWDLISLIFNSNVFQIRGLWKYYISAWAIRTQVDFLQFAPKPGVINGVCEEELHIFKVLRMCESSSDHTQAPLDTQLSINKLLQRLAQRHFSRPGARWQVGGSLQQQQQQPRSI